MVRVRPNVASLRKKKRFFKKAKGYWGGRHRLWQTVREAILRADAYAYRDRKARKRYFRRLWITRITAAAEKRGIKYSRFIAGLKKAGIELNRKALSEIAIHEPEVFDTLVEKAKSAMNLN